MSVHSAAGIAFAVLLTVLVGIGGIAVRHGGATVSSLNTVINRHIPAEARADEVAMSVRAARREYMHYLRLERIEPESVAEPLAELEFVLQSLTTSRYLENKGEDTVNLRRALARAKRSFFNYRERETNHSDLEVLRRDAKATAKAFTDLNILAQKAIASVDLDSANAELDTMAQRSLIIAGVLPQAFDRYHRRDRTTLADVKTPLTQALELSHGLPGGNPQLRDVRERLIAVLRRADWLLDDYREEARLGPASEASQQTREKLSEIWPEASARLHELRVRLDERTGEARAVALSSAQRGQLYLTGLTIVAVVIGLGAFYALWRYVSLRIDRLAGAAQRLANGELGYRLDVQEGDRLALLAEAYNHLAASLEIKVAEQERAEREIRRLAYYDPVTDLPNRIFLGEHVQRLLANARRHHHLLAIMFVDLDHFKRVNDTLGHEAGDKLLADAANRLSLCVRRGDVLTRHNPEDSLIKEAEERGNTLVRLGGDEFVAVLTHIRRMDDAAVVAKRIIKAFDQPFLLSGKSVLVTTSIGISVFPTDGVDMQTLLKKADAALYEAKDHGRNTYRFYSRSLHERVHNRLSVESDLRKALDRNELLLHYQPRVCLRTGRTVGVEALVRWHHPDRGLILPGEFIPVAEETGLVVPVGEFVLRSACVQAQSWLLENKLPLRISVNVSAAQFRQASLPNLVETVLKDTQLPAASLELELTEGILMKNTEASIQVLTALRALGTAVSVDDFGTGYSCLSYLQHFPLSALKIDRTFVRDATTDSGSASIVRAVIGLAHSLGLSVVAEGVETDEQMAFLRTHKCDEVQGYLLARPMPADNLNEWMASLPEQRLGSEASRMGRPRLKHKTI